MNQGNGGIIAIGVATGINAIYAIKHGHVLYVTIAGGIVLAFFVAALGSVGTALAYTFLLGTLVYRSEDLWSFLSGIINAK